MFFPLINVFFFLFETLHRHEFNRSNAADSTIYLFFVDMFRSVSVPPYNFVPDEPQTHDTAVLFLRMPGSRSLREGMDPPPTELHVHHSIQYCLLLAPLPSVIVHPQRWNPEVLTYLEGSKNRYKK